MTALRISGNLIELILILLLISSSGYSQKLPEEEATEGRVPSSLDIDFQEEIRSSGAIVPQAQFLEQAFETAIDSNTYVLGPGDQLLIKVWGALDNQFIAPVSPDGYVIIPSVKEVRVVDKTLAQASKEIRSSLAAAIRRSSFSVRLMKLRKFRVIVSGEVDNPGTYYLRAIDRVSDAIQLAGGLADWGDDTRIQLRHANGAPTDTVNINDFYFNGNLENNNFLNGGDVIYVPPIDLTKNYAIIQGNVGSQGIYQIRPNETLFAFLTRLRAINRRSNISNVVLSRGDEQIYFNLLDPTSGARTEKLETGDRVIIPSTKDKVYVQGEVQLPGALPYFANYNVSDYAGLAGILETAKDLDEFYVIRARDGQLQKGRNITVQNGDIVVVPRKSRETFKDYLTILTPLVSIGLSIVAISNATSN